MKTTSSILLCMAFALAAAKPWYSNSYKARASHQRAGYYDSEGYYHRAAETAMTHETFSAAKIQQKAGILDSCQSAKYSSGNIDTYVHVCETGVSASGDKEYCYITNGDCCIVSSGTSYPVEGFKLSLEQLTVNVKYYGAIGAKGACFDLDKDLAVCGGCSNPFCVETVCLNNTLTETLSSCDQNGRCTCKPGFASPDCCECDFENGYFRDPLTRECKPFCETCSRRTVNGCAECQVGHAGLDCCDCDDGYYMSVDKTCKTPRCTRNHLSCTDGRCTCKPGYLPQDCCECADGHYYNPTTETCDVPCDNTKKCTKGNCLCDSGYTGIHCCEKETVECVSEQDVFFVVDVTTSNGRDSFCRTHYGTELLLAALKPGSELTVTRVEMVLFPMTPSVSENKLQDLLLFPLGTGCQKAVGDTLTLIDTFYNYQFSQPLSTDYYYRIHAGQTYPAPAIQAVRRSIENSQLARPRVVVILTDGLTDERSNNPRLADEINKLREMDPRITIIVGGNNAQVLAKDQDAFRGQLVAIAGDRDNVVISSDSVTLARGIVQKMAAAEAICPNQETEILQQLQGSNTRSFCECIKSRRTNPGKVCRVPDGFTCDGGTSGRNPYYSPSMGSKKATFQNNNEKSELEQEILQAVEEVLHKRININ